MNEENIRPIQESKTINVDEILAKYDKESTFRILSGSWEQIIKIICICFSLFQLYTAAFGVFPAQIQRAVHLAFATPLIFLLYPATSKGSRSSMHPLDVVLALLGTSIGLYMVVFYGDIMLRGGLPTFMDLFFGAMAVLLVLEAARRVVGLPISLIAALWALLVPGRTKGHPVAGKPCMARIVRQQEAQITVAHRQG